MGLINFGINASKLWSGVNYSQLVTNEKDHNKQYTGKKIPLGVTFALTFICNFECAHCGADIDNSKSDQDASTKLMIDTLNELKRLGGQRISLTGGEPLVRKDIKDILQTAYKNKFFVSLTTNGWFVERHLDKLKNLDLLVLSLDGTEPVHDFIRRKPGSFKKVMESIKTAKKNNIPVLVNTTVMNTNVDDMPGLSKILKELEVYWTIDLYLDNTNIKSWQKGSNISRPTDKLLTQVISLAKDNPYLANSSHYLNATKKKENKNSNKPQTCFAGIGYCVVSPDAKLYPCFPAQFDNEFEGMDLKKMSFDDAFQKMPLYRKNCGSCDYICHLEMNSLYSFNPNSIFKGLKYLYKDKFLSLFKRKNSEK